MKLKISKVQTLVKRVGKYTRKCRENVTDASSLLEYKHLFCWLLNAILSLSSLVDFCYYQKVCVCQCVWTLSLLWAHQYTDRHLAESSREKERHSLLPESACTGSDERGRKRAGVVMFESPFQLSE